MVAGCGANIGGALGPSSGNRCLSPFRAHFPAICLQKGFLDSRPGQRRAIGKRAARVQPGVAQRCNRPGSARIGQDRDLARDLGEGCAKFRRNGFWSWGHCPGAFWDSRCTPGQAGTHWPRLRATGVSEKDFFPAICFAVRVYRFLAEASLGPKP